MNSYIHTLNGKPAYFDQTSGILRYATSNRPVEPRTRRQIRLEQSQHKSRTIGATGIGMQRVGTLCSIAQLPRYTKRRIVWNQNGDGGQAIILVGYCPDTLPYFMAMAKDVKKRIPEANLDKAICGKVSKSDTVQGFTLLIAPVPGPKRNIRGFEEYDSINFNY